MAQEMIANHNYGPIRKGECYKYFNSGRDWHRIQAGGHIFHIPSWVFESESE